MAVVERLPLVEVRLYFSEHTTWECHTRYFLLQDYGWPVRLWQTPSFNLIRLSSSSKRQPSFHPSKLITLTVYFKGMPHLLAIFLLKKIVNCGRYLRMSCSSAKLWNVITSLKSINALLRVSIIFQFIRQLVTQCRINDVFMSFRLPCGMCNRA